MASVSDRPAGVPPDRSDEQRARALLEANRVRFHRAAVKRKIGAGELDALEVLADPDLATMAVSQLLRAIPGVGPVKANRILVATKISASRTLAGLTPRQRREFMLAVARIRPRKRPPSPHRLNREALESLEADLTDS